MMVTPQMAQDPGLHFWRRYGSSDPKRNPTFFCQDPIFVSIESTCIQFARLLTSQILTHCAYLKQEQHDSFLSKSMH